MQWKMKLAMLTTATIMMCLDVSGNAEGIKDMDTCLQVIEKIATFDTKFTFRPDQISQAKKALGITANGMSKVQLSEALNSKTTLDGTRNRCGSTEDWITDVMDGTKAPDDSKFAEYHEENFGDLVSKFEFYATEAAQNHVLFKLRLESGIGGCHAWIIHQFKATGTGKDPEYRIYQSYVGAYTLEAWLAKTATNARNANIFVNWRTRCGKPTENPKPKDCESDEFKGAAGAYKERVKILEDLAGKAKANKLKDEEGSKPDAFQKYLDFITNKNAKEPVEDFEVAWNAYGKAKTLSKANIFVGDGSFIGQMGKLIHWLNTASEIKEFPDDIYKLYKGLFGAPLLDVFPDIRVNRFLKDSRLSQLKMKPVLLDMKLEAEINKDCVAEGKRIAGRLFK